jgi:hypothetical protein
MKFLEELEQILILRKKELPEKSYTADLFKKGVDRNSTWRSYRGRWSQWCWQIDIVKRHCGDASTHPR